MTDQDLSPPLTPPPVQDDHMPWYKRIVTKSFYTDILLGKRTFPLFTAVFIMAAAFSIMPAITISTQIYPLMRSIERNVNTIIDDVLPEKAEINISHGIVKTNLIEPFYLTINKSTLDTIYPSFKSQTGSSKIRLITIDTKAQPEDLEKYQSFMLLTETELVTYGEDKVDIKSVKSVGEKTFTRASVKKLVNDTLDKYHVLTVLNILFFLNPIILVLVAGIAIFIDLLLTAIVIRIMGNILGITARYRDVLRFTAAIALVPLLLMIIAGHTFAMRGLSFNLSISDSFTHVLILWFAYLLMRGGVKQV